MPSATYDDLATAFRHGNFKPLYFLFGDEPFMMDELQELAVEHALQAHERDFNLEIVYGHEVNVADLLARCAAYPMMAERRLIVVRGFEQVADNAVFKAYAERPNPTAVVMLLCSGKPNLTHHPYRALKQHAVAVELKTPGERQLPGWISDRLRRKGYRATGNASAMLASRVDGGLRGAASEVEKLITFVGDAKEISEADVLSAAGESHHANPFRLQDALGRGDDAGALAVAHAILAHAADRRGEAIMVVAILTGYFLRVWKLTGCRESGVPEDEWPRQLGVPPFAVRGYVSALRHYPSARIGVAFEALLAADSELKGGSERDPRTIITLALRRIAKAAPTRGRRPARREFGEAPAQ